MNREDKLKFAEDNKHIPTAEIEQDISDTKVEIIQLEREADFLAETPMGMQETKLNHMRANAKRSGIDERKIFIEKLQAILEIRKEVKNGN